MRSAEIEEAQRRATRSNAPVLHPRVKYVEDVDEIMEHVDTTPTVPEQEDQAMERDDTTGGGGGSAPVSNGAGTVHRFMALHGGKMVLRVPYRCTIQIPSSGPADNGQIYVPFYNTLAFYTKNDSNQILAAARPMVGVTQVFGTSAYQPGESVFRYWQPLSSMMRISNLVVTAARPTAGFETVTGNETPYALVGEDTQGLIQRMPNVSYPVANVMQARGALISTSSVFNAGSADAPLSAFGKVTKLGATSTFEKHFTWVNLPWSKYTWNTNIATEFNEPTPGPAPRNGTDLYLPGGTIPGPTNTGIGISGAGLIQQGRCEAPFMALWIPKVENRPELILSARATLETEIVICMYTAKYGAENVNSDVTDRDWETKEP